MWPRSRRASPAAKEGRKILSLKDALLIAAAFVIGVLLTERKQMSEEQDRLRAAAEHEKEQLAEAEVAKTAAETGQATAETAQKTAEDALAAEKAGEADIAASLEADDAAPVQETPAAG